MKAKDIIIIISGLLAGFLIGRIGRKVERQEIEIVKTDTLVVWDTIQIDRPVPVKEIVVNNIYVPVTDTVQMHDTTFVVLQRTQKEYKDSLYHAWVSGFDPALDSISVFSKTQFVNTVIREKPKKWHLGVQGGYGVSKDGLSPYIGLGVTYSLISF